MSAQPKEKLVRHTNRSSLIPALTHYVRVLASSAILFFAVLTVLFFLLEIAPGDPVQSFVGDQPVSDDFRAHITASFGLDGSLTERYARYMLNIVRGDLGTSYPTLQPVTELIAGRAGSTLALAIPSFI